MNNQEIAKKVIDALGGRENVNSVAHCATRLRVMVKDEGKINKEVIENLEKVQGAFFNSGQYQIIFGTGTVNKMYDEVVALGLSTSSKDDMKAEAAKQGNWFQRAIRTFGDVFVPIIPVIVATGLFMGVRGLLTALGMTLPADVTTYTQILTDTAFIILPGLVVWSTFRVFGGNPAVGIVLGMMLVSGSLPNAWAVASGGEVTAMNFFGFIPVVGLQGSVLPAFIIGVVGAKFEKAVRKVVPDVIDLLVTPFVTLLVMSILGLFVIGPVFHVVENYILIATKAILSLPFGFGGFLIGGVHQLIVVSGVHHIFNLLEVQLLAADHANPFNAIITAAMTAQGAATVAVGVKTKNPKLKTLAFPAALSAFLGITEPAIFGVNLRFRKPFFLSLIAGAIGGGLASILGLAGTGNGITIIPGTMLYIGNGQLVQYLLMVAVSFALGFALTYMFGYEDEKEVATEVETERLVQEETTGNIPAALQNETLVTPIVGDVVALADVNDPVFSSGAMGQGIAVKPSQGVVYAPADAEVSIAFPTGHAFGLKTTDGAEVLIHVGIDTVSMNGDGFEAKVAQGDKVKAGDVLGTFDSNKIAAAGLDDTTMVIVTNTADYASVTPVATGSVAKGDAVIEVKI
ncbi:PTS beta-glucoside transporter subunit IIBCA [Streptococcus pseudopneumoniae]|uniref:PTS system sucrose-specific EIIBCA component n=1 Tax=Streptococcus pseudopneumoniae TaxID=257758 RepID=A0A0T8U5P8_9STRE|nr:MULTISPECIES: sucrose-specific PTS transporter subunit IIBC [Streptococcus]EID71128.1 PTS system sucrose-specific IIBC component [Streptococcus pseudopneumoniae SK674]ETD94159.1 PTS sucrose transporter subunit IIABC [Streptococcus pseudopneumoniae 1321]MBF9640537.1 PTS glucose transporter subunit IIA [Streptococcus pseudopneumoniae]MBF9642538.1 PTS glucose transporter subunit IIA [Streptococcus pseudopneumoniae]MBF9644606.1 PTS glucose transporter subunit IIA [Streptococcus pseudopneumoniae